MARYHVLHETHYDYGGMVSLSQQILHLVPRPSPWQACLRYELSIDPEPSWRTAGQDAFGNPVEWLGFYQPHPELNVRAEMEVDGSRTSCACTPRTVSPPAVRCSRAPRR
jgi:transglutaminase-like putative cysteine protease